MKLVQTLIALSLAVLPASLAANVIPPSEDYRVVRVEFNGTVTSSITDNIVVRGSDGSVVPYTGPIPDYPFNTGDAIIIGFDTIVPTGQAIADGIVPQSADGIYSFQIGPRPEQLDQFPGTGSFGNFYGNGGIADTGTYGTDGNLNIVYDANADSYSLGLLRDGTSGATTDLFGIGFFDFPFLAYDIATDRLFTANIVDLFPSNSGTALTGLSATEGRIPTTIFNFNGSEFLGGTPVGALQDGNIRFTGSWNLPIFGQNPTPVPAPGMMVLFGLGLGLIAARRRKAATA